MVFVSDLLLIIGFNFYSNCYDINGNWPIWIKYIWGLIRFVLFHCSRTYCSLNAALLHESPLKWVFMLRFLAVDQLSGHIPVSSGFYSNYYFFRRDWRYSFILFHWLLYLLPFRYLHLHLDRRYFLEVLQTFQSFSFSYPWNE